MRQQKHMCQPCEHAGRNTYATTGYISKFSNEKTHCCAACLSDVREMDRYYQKTAAADFSNFGGQSYDPVKDRERLGKQLCRVMDLMIDGKPRTLRQISDATHDPEASISARLRDVRKVFGKDSLESTRVKGGLWTYRYRGAA